MRLTGNHRLRIRSSFALNRQKIHSNILANPVPTNICYKVYIENILRTDIDRKEMLLLLMTLCRIRFTHSFVVSPLRIAVTLRKDQIVTLSPKEYGKIYE